MLDYNQIEKLFGVPLNTVPKPNIPFKFTTTNVVVGGLILIIFGFGVKALIDKALPKVKLIDPQKASKSKIPNNSPTPNNDTISNSFSGNNTILKDYIESLDMEEFDAEMEEFDPEILEQSDDNENI